MDKKFKDGLKVLVYGDINKLVSNMNHHFLDQLDCVSDDMTQDPETIGELNAYILQGGYTHLVIPDENFHQLNGSLEDCVVPVVELLEDHWVVWAVERKKRYLRENKIRHAFVFSERFQEPYGNMTKFYPVLSGFDSSTFFDQGIEREIDILISGSLGKKSHALEVYPVRNWLARVLPEIGVKEGIKVEILSHPGYILEEGVGKKTIDYAKVLNRAKIAIGGSSYWKLPLKKFYEIPACGVILLSDLPFEDAGFFKGRILEISPEKIPDKSYVDKVRRDVMNALGNYDKCKQELQPFRSEEDVFCRSYEGKALEMRAILKTIN